MVTVAALYRFTPFPDPAALRAPLLAACLYGRGRCAGPILLATGGGERDGRRVAVRRESRRFWPICGALPGCAALEAKVSTCRHAPPFGKLQGAAQARDRDDGTARTGARKTRWGRMSRSGRLERRWSADSGYGRDRHAQRLRGGHRERSRGRVDPGTEAVFGDFPAWWEANREAPQFAGKRVAMFCTGGIRCEKSTAFLRSKGVEDVVHLQRGHPEVSRGGCLRRRACGAAAVSCSTTGSASVPV